MKRSPIGKKLRELRLAHQLSLREAARRLSISASRLSDFEEGRTHSTSRPAIPGRAFLDRAASLYHVPVPALLGLAGHLAEAPVTYFPTDIEADIAEIAALYEQLPYDYRMHLLDVARTFRRFVPQPSPESARLETRDAAEGDGEL